MAEWFKAHAWKACGGATHSRVRIPPCPFFKRLWGGSVPFTVSVDHARQRVTGVATGGITVADLGLYVAERVRQGAYSYPQLIDVRAATIDVPPGESLFGIAMEQRRQFTAGAIPRTAIVANPGTATYGLVRQLAVQLGFSKAQVEVFSEIDEAESWLNRQAHTPPA